MTDLLFSHQVMSNSLRPHELQHTRLPCPSLSPTVCSNSCPLSWWYHPIISSSVVPFSCPQSFLASGSFPISLLFISDGQSIGASASASVLPVNIQGLFPLGLTGSISLQSKGLTRVFSEHLPVCNFIHYLTSACLSYYPNDGRDCAVLLTFYAQFLA